jgi:ligand-binding SRPBCC domain-containing protein
MYDGFGSLTICIETEIHASCHRCFDLARSVDFHAAAAREIDAKAVSGNSTGLAELDDTTTWSARFYGIRFPLTTTITQMDAPNSFTDTMTKGYYRKFEHRYTFEPIGEDSCRMVDELTIEMPFGRAGVLIYKLLLAQKMQFLMEIRSVRIKAAAESSEWQKL